MGKNTNYGKVVSASRKAVSYGKVVSKRDMNTTYKKQDPSQHESAGFEGALAKFENANEQA